MGIEPCVFSDGLAVLPNDTLEQLRPFLPFLLRHFGVFCSDQIWRLTVSLIYIYSPLQVTLLKLIRCCFAFSFFFTVVLWDGRDRGNGVLLLSASHRRLRGRKPTVSVSRLCSLPARFCNTYTINIKTSIWSKSSACQHSSGSASHGLALILTRRVGFKVAQMLDTEFPCRITPRKVG